MGKLSRNKGAAGEREAIKVLRAELGDTVADQLARNLQQTRDGGLGGDMLGLGLWAIEIKRTAKTSHPGWWAQAIEQAGDARIPVVMYRIDRAREWRVRVHIACVCTASFYDWPVDDLSGCLDMTVQAFAAIVRERQAINLKEAG